MRTPEQTIRSGFRPGGRRRGTIFLLALGVMTVLFILGFSMIFFTGSEDWSTSLNYESEVAFNLAESAIEEFVARFKNSLNRPGDDNVLYKVLRDGAIPKNEIPLNAAQVANLTTLARSTAATFGIPPRDFNVEAKIALKEIRGVPAKLGNKPLYEIRLDPREKQGELKVTAEVAYKYSVARVSLTFLIRVVKSYAPPFNYFTLYVKDGSTQGGSNFNPWKSRVGRFDVPGEMKRVNLDHGWTYWQNPFDAVTHAEKWEKMLAEQAFPPGRVYLGADPEASPDPGMFPLGVGALVQSTNGVKFHVPWHIGDHPTSFQHGHRNAGENLFQLPDVPWMQIRKYVDGKENSVMSAMGQDFKEGKNTGKNWLTQNLLGFLNKWKAEAEIRVQNVGAGEEVWYENPKFTSDPTFQGALFSLRKFSEECVALRDLIPPMNKSGMHLFGHARAQNPSMANPDDGTIETRFLSPTLVYGPVNRAWFRVISVRRTDVKGADGNPVELDLPFIGTEYKQYYPVGNLPGDNKSLAASEAVAVYRAYKVPQKYLDVLGQHWDQVVPEGMNHIDKMAAFMSNWGTHNYNQGLGNFLVRMKRHDPPKKYDGLLNAVMLYPIENEVYPNASPEVQSFIGGSRVRLEYAGLFWHAMPDQMSAFLMDFYFIPRSTEDFFRGRTTITVGGTAFDRFVYKYIDDPGLYNQGTKGQTLNLNGVLALNDPETLELRDLRYQGRGVIYSSPMMGGGAVAILGDFYPAAKKQRETEEPASAQMSNDMMTIIAKCIVIDTSSAESNPCFVEANLISTERPVMIVGSKDLVIKGTVACPYWNLAEHVFKGQQQGNLTIRYNPLNTAHLNEPDRLPAVYVAKVVTGGVGKFDWKSEYGR